MDFVPLLGVKETIKYLNTIDRRVAFITNNSSKSSATYKKKLSDLLDIDISMDNIYTSTQATIDYLQKNDFHTVYPIGTPEFEDELLSQGITISMDDPQLVVLAFDMTLTYEKLMRACLLINAGRDYISTHPDKVCPTKMGYIPDVGSIISLIETATGKKPKKILGKPNPEMIYYLLDRFKLKPDDGIIFGDRLYTDIKMGKHSGITTALMLTGESTIEDIDIYNIEPDFVFRDFNEVLNLLNKV